MNTALVYSFNTIKTARVAEHIKSYWGDGLAVINAEEANGKQLAGYDNLICGVPTWFDGELPNYWDEMIPEIEGEDWSGKQIAVFGLGDQVNYPENFVDGIGILAEIFENCGATVKGFSPINHNTFESSRAQRGEQFCGLALDLENYPGEANSQMETWVKQLKEEFGTK